MKPIKIENWNVVEAKEYDPYVAPEMRKRRLRGDAIDHPKRPMKPIWDCVTSYIIKIEGRLIYTYSGSVYELVGNPSSDYLIWMKANGYKYNPENPIRMI